MKKVLLVVVLTVAAFVYAQSFSDVPVNHWAYEAVTTLSKLGIVSGMPDGTFQGNNPMTRYQVAVAMKKLMDYLTQQIEKGMASGDLQNVIKRLSTVEDLISTTLTRVQRNSEQISASDQTLQTVLAEISNLKSTIVDIAQVKKDMPTMIAASENKMMTMYNQLSAKVSAVEKTVSDLQAQISSQILSQLKGNIDAINANISSVSSKVDSLSAKVDAISKSVDQVKVDVTTLSKRVDAVESNIQTLLTLRKSFADLEARVATLESKLATDVDSLKKALTTTSNQLDARLSLVEGQVASLATDVEKLKKDMADATQAAKKVSVLEGNVGTLAGQVVSLNQKVSQNEQDIAAVKKTVDGKPWKTDIEAATVQFSKKIDEVYNMALIGIIVGAAGAVIGLLGMLF
ncbi:S-layer homology domain-containing protein [Thermotoga profunda]|uniref:S-layer homology domain-containing protein n=1 Tax=Thermotoga profunda TaxID=1508420 RepID=UPI0005977ED9|nr:S-layer homology domain-containing protein [Thermotoga profunda]